MDTLWMDHLIEDLFPTKETPFNKLAWYTNLTKRYPEFEWPTEYPPVVCESVWNDVLLFLNTESYTSETWLSYMELLRRIQRSSASHLRACVDAMVTNPKGVTTIQSCRAYEIKKFFKMYPEVDRVALLRFFILNSFRSTTDNDLYLRHVLYTIKNEFHMRCYLQSLPKAPSLATVIDCTIDYDDPLFELDMLYLSAI
jgi:hypothetical protein